MKGIKIYLTWARPGEGKSVDTARTIHKLFKEYHRTERRYPDLPHRVLYSNLKLSPEIEAKELMYDLKTNTPLPGARHLMYWENPRQLKDVRDCDIVIDEANNYFPADGWKDLPRWLRKLFAQHRHRGIRVFANTQDYKAVDINFRRMVGHAYKVEKLFSSRDISATLPPPKMIFGLIVKREFKPDQIEVEGANDIKKLEEASGFPTIFLLTRKLIETYDTTQDIPEYMPNSLEHLEFRCLNPDCKKIHIEHRKT